MPFPPDEASEPSRLSLGLTVCLASGCRLSILWPNWAKERLPQDISTELSAGPTAWEARLEFVSEMATCCGAPPANFQTLALASREPNGLIPLKSFCARPSQKLRKLKTA